MNFPAYVWLTLLIVVHTSRNAFSQSADSEFKKIDVLCKKASSQLFSNPDSAFLTAQRARQLSEAIHYELGIANSQHLTGEVFYHQGFYNEALNNLLKAETIYKSTGRRREMGENLNQLGLVYYNIRQPDLALKKHQEALALYEALSDQEGVAYTYGCIGRLYEKKNRYQDALKYQQKALEYYRKVGNNRGIANISENIGSIYEDLEKYDTAQSYFSKAYHLNEQTSDSLSMIINLNNLADGFRKTNRNEQAIEYSGRALALAKRFNDKYQVISAYKDLGKVYNQAGRYQEAYENLEKGRTLYEEMYGEETRRQVALLQTLFELERKNNEIKSLESSEQLSSVIKIALLFGLLLLVMLAVAIISRQRLKIRQDKETINRKESHQKLIETELENAHLHEEQLQHELTNKSKSLTAHTLHIISKNKILEDIRTKLNETLKEDMREQRKKMLSLVKLIDHNFIQDKDWDDFRSIFEQVHQNFFDQLHKFTPELTAADLRLAALIRLNLPSKDVSTILGISPDSLRISRYRLKKKLNLHQGDSLTTFILSV